jgi:sortase (surface protein transpeptidase)
MFLSSIREAFTGFLDTKRRLLLQWTDFMQRSFLIAGIALLSSAAFANASDVSAPSAPLFPPEAGVERAAAAQEAPTPDPDYPVRIALPSIGLDTSVVEVGVTKTGEMDVPSGKTKDVGWYKDGTVPGEVGSAVMDAHVYAAFDKLKYLKVGADIYVVARSGKSLHFRVTDSRIYKLGELPIDLLFNQSDAKRLNLITCAGSYSRTLGTYDHRLVAYAVLVEEK